MTELESFARGTAGLWVLMIVAACLAAARPQINRDPGIRNRFTIAATAALTVQLLHFSEELIAGFHERFPTILGLPKWTAELFVGFNVFWLFIWAISILCVRRACVAALLPLWFLAVGMVANAIAHPALSMRTGGYFPGVISAPVAGLFGALLLHQLFRLTRPSLPIPSLRQDSDVR
jgi:hypothetical protein